MQSLDAQAMAASVVKEIESIYRESYGTGAGSATAEFVGVDALVCFLEELEFLPHEQFLIDNGREEQLIHTRHDFQQAIAASFRAAVERATGRTVRNFNSITNITPPVAIEIFMFDPLNAPDDVR